MCVGPIVHFRKGFIPEQPPNLLKWQAGSLWLEDVQADDAKGRHDDEDQIVPPADLLKPFGGGQEID